MKKGAPAALLLLGKAMGKGQPKEGGEEMDMKGEAETDAAARMISAVKSNDPEAFSEALKAHYEACGVYDQGESDDKEEY